MRGLDLTIRTWPPSASPPLPRSAQGLAMPSVTSAPINGAVRPDADTSAACVVLVDPARAAGLRRVVPNDLKIHHARDSRHLATMLADNVGSLVVVDPVLLSHDVLDLIDSGLPGWRVVVDATTTAVGLNALWQILRATSATIILRDYDGHGHAPQALGSTHGAPDELMRAWTPMLSCLPVELARAVTATTCGHATAESVSALAALAGRSRRWAELRFGEVGVHSPWRVVVGSRIARAHEDLINPALRSHEIASRHGFGSVRTLRSQVESVVGVSLGIVRAGMGAAMLATSIAATMAR